MDTLTPASTQETVLAALIQEQESDALDDGFPYEQVGLEADLDRGTMGWITPTAFMVVSLKELLMSLVAIYGWNGHWLLRDIGRDNLRDPAFVSNLGLSMFCSLYDAALSALPADEQKRLGYVE